MNLMFWGMKSMQAASMSPSGVMLICTPSPLVTRSLPLMLMSLPFRLSLMFALPDKCCKATVSGVTAARWAIAILLSISPAWSCNAFFDLQPASNTVSASRANAMFLIFRAIVIFSSFYLLFQYIGLVTGFKRLVPVYDGTLNVAAFCKYVANVVEHYGANLLVQ